METKKNSGLENLSENARRILFLLVAVPGGKNIAMLREALGLDEGRKSYEVNVLTIRFCEELQRAGFVSLDPQNYSNNSKRMCRLKTMLPLAALAELAAEGTRRNWWPDRASILRLCRGIGFRTADSADKHWYEGQENVLEGVAEFVRILLTGEGLCIVPSQKTKSGEQVQIAFVEHWTTVVDPRTDIFAGAGRTRIPLAMMTHALDTLFLKGRDVRPTLAGVVDECFRRIGEVRAYDLFEMSALAVWTGRTDLVRKLNERDWTDPFALRYLDALSRFPDERAVFDLFAELQTYVEKKDRSSVVQGAAFSLLAIGVALRSGQPGPVIARFKRFLDGSMATVDPVKSPLVTENRNRRKYLLTDFRSADTPYFSSAFERRLYIHCPPADFARVFSSYLFFLSWGKLPRSKLVAVREDLLRTLPTVFIALGCGYATVAAAMTAVLGPFLDAQTATELAEKVKAAEGLWLWPFVSPEETWRDALAELETLAKPKPRTKGANADGAAEGNIGWMLSFRPLGFASKGDVSDLASMTPLLVRADEYGAQYEEIRPDDVLSHRLDDIRTAQDALILAAYRQRVSITMTPELIDRLIGHPHLFIQDDSRYSRPVPVELVRGELRVHTKVRENGGIELSVPEWMRELASKDFFHEERPGLYVHYALADREWKILTVFREQGVNGVIRVPKEGLDSVAALLPNLASHVLITGAFAPKQEERDGSLPVKPGGTQAVARLRFANDVLEIDLGVASSAELPFAVPEVGDAESVRHGAEGLYLLRRDFAAETAALAPAVAALEPVLACRVATYSWRISDLLLAIGALEALQATGDMRLEWPEGKSLTLEEAGECRLSFSGMARERGWFEVRGKFELDPEHVLSIFEALAALRNGVGDYIRLSEGRFLRLTEGLRRKLAILNAASRRNFDALEVSPAAVLPLARVFSQSDDGDELPEALKERARELAKILRKRQKPPRNLHATLRD